MARQVPNRREDAREEIPAPLGAAIEFQGPDGARLAVRLISVSARGASFSIVMPSQFHRIEKGAVLKDAVIRVGNTVVHGNLSVAHTTRGFDKDYTCGVLFYPASESDRNELTTLVARLAALPKVPTKARRG
jgi:hypothetical protein